MQTSGFLASPKIFKVLSVHFSWATTSCSYRVAPSPGLGSPSPDLPSPSFLLPSLNYLSGPKRHLGWRVRWVVIVPGVDSFYKVLHSIQLQVAQVAI